MKKFNVCSFLNKHQPLADKIKTVTLIVQYRGYLVRNNFIVYLILYNLFIKTAT
jgi:hypothetical protein